jgi:hypothetical protein
VIPFPEFKRNPHNDKWETGDWTDDTDQMILILDTLLEHDGELPLKVFAQKLSTWSDNGFRELGDKYGLGLGGTVGRVITQDCFLDDPHTAAEITWNQLNKDAAPNGKSYIP